MGYIFRPGLHACDAGGRLVFLDVAADRYFALADPLDRLCRRLVAGDEVSPQDFPAVDNLVARGVVHRVAFDAVPETCSAAPALRVDLQHPAGRASKHLVSMALARHAFAIVELKARSLASVLRGLERRKLRSPPARIKVDPAELAHAFVAADRILTAHGRCLPRSLALARAMMAAGVAPDLVLGVKLRPFEAHCWVQHGDLLVSDELATVAPFTPILIL